MIFDTLGNKSNPAIVMINGSFTSGKSLSNIAEKLADEFFMIMPTYDGHHENGGEFSTRDIQVQKMIDFLRTEDIHEIALIQGISMGAEVALDLAAAVYHEPDMNVKSCFFNGGPFFSFNIIMRKIMQRKFLGFVHDCQHGSVDEIMERFGNNKMVQWMVKGNIEPYRGMIIGMADVAPFMSDKSIRNESDACYTFDFPEIPMDEQKKYVFSWSSDEPAFKSCKKIKKRYPYAVYKNDGKLGHGGLIMKQPDKYADVMRKLAKRTTL